MAVKHNKCQSREAAGLRFTARFRNAVGAAARDSDFKLGWIWVIRQSHPGLSQEGELETVAREQEKRKRRNRGKGGREGR